MVCGHTFNYAFSVAYQTGRFRNHPGLKIRSEVQIHR